MENATALNNKNQELETEVATLTAALDKANALVEILQIEKTASDEKLAAFLEQIKLDKLRRFGSASEANLLQPNLFDDLDVPDEDEGGQETITYTRKKRQQTPRQPLPEHLRREVVIVDVSEEEKRCDCCQQPRVKMGDVVHECLAVKPAELYVKEYRRPKYVCNRKSCIDETIVVADNPMVLPKTQADSSVLAHIITSKYVDHLPLYRQEKQWKRQDIVFTRAQMSKWMMLLSDKLKPLYHILIQILMGFNVIHVDETRVQVLREKDRADKKKGYMWCYCGGPPDKRAMVFEYHASRSGDHPKAFLIDFNGYVISDAYTGYDWLDDLSAERYLHVYCMTHARRPFAEIVKLTKTPGVAHNVVDYMAKLYAVEKEAREAKMTPSERFLLRVRKSKPVLDALFKYLTETVDKVPKSLKLGKAIRYMLTRKEGFYTYLYDGRAEIDNNAIENEIRGFAIGRKNWMFIGSPRGADAACMLYSLIQTCRLNNIEPFAYFEWMLSKLPYCKTTADFEALMPWCYH